MNSASSITRQMIDDSIIGQLASTILGECPTGSKVILFGSRARATHRADSDIDLMVVQPGEPDRMKEAARLIQVIRSFRLPVDVIVVRQKSFDDWKDVINTVYNEAARDGKVFA